MAVITATNLSKSYGPVDIFTGLSLNVARRGRVAIVGPNGIGKSTLLRILAGEEAPTEGKVQLARGAKLGYLPQEAQFEAKHSLWQECLGGLSELLAQEAKLKALEAEIGEKPGDKDLLERYGKFQQRFEHSGGYTYETRVRQVLTGLGFEETDYELTLDKLSGGQRTRALLARLLLTSPDLLVLDEPTNHLDIHAVEWLESYLRGWEGAVLIVSHDRYFLDRVATHVWEMSRAAFEVYRGNYSAYLQQRAARWAERQQFIESEKARLHRELEYIKKNIAGQNTTQAKGKLRRLSREVRAIESGGWLATKGKAWHEYGSAVNTLKVHEAEARLKALTAPDDRIDHAFKLQIRSKARSGNIVLRGEDFTIGYPTKRLFSVEELELRRLECAALIGPNGSGKTTYLRTIMGELEALEGEVRLGASLKIGYFAQAHEDLDPKLTLIEEIDRVGTGMLEKEIRNYLGRFLFSGDEHYKRVSVLSGGERGRLALAKLSLLNANLLLLDEPSNHLDIPAQEVLQQVLASFDGTILMVSHDRYLIDALATQVWEIDPNQQGLTVFEGSYSEYKGIEQEQSQQEEKAAVTQREAKKTEKQAAPQAKAKRSKHQQQRLDTKIHALEDRILDLEQKLDDLGQKLANPPEDPDEILSLSEDYAYFEVELAGALVEWEALHQEE